MLFLATPLHRINFDILPGYFIATLRATVPPPLKPNRYGLFIFNFFINS